jgi:membrane associated rhomboid family serine protease
MTGESPLDRFQRWYRLLPPALRFLLTVNTVIYVAWFFVRLSQPAAAFVVEYLALNPALPTVLFRPWQLLTYSVVHLQVGFWGLISFGFNMLWLYWMGRDFEETYGSHRLFGLYVLAALGGALLAVLLGAVIPDGRLFPVDGAMAPVFGVLFCVATLYPNRGIGLFIIGVVPLKWLAGGFLLLSVLFTLGHPALLLTYLGGAGVGFLFGWAQQRGTDLAAWAQAFFPQRSAYGGYSAPARAEEKGGVLARLDRWLAGRKGSEDAPRRASSSGKTDTGRRMKRVPKKDVEVVGPADIDRILDKINERGYDALTEEEKRALYEASQND